MVKIVLALFFLSLNLLFGDIVDEKIKSLVDSSTYAKNKAFIDAATSPKSDYLRGNNEVDSIKLIKTLKDNGILKLFFKSPKELSISFKTKSNPNFFVKVMNDSLVNIGYYKYITQEADYNGEDFVWTISLVSEYITDPIVLNEELKKSGSMIVDVIRESETKWIYVVDMESAKLNIASLLQVDEYRLKRSLYAHWLDVSGVKKLQISSSALNSWYPYIAYYDRSLNLLSVQKIDSKTANLTLDIAPKCAYIKISDLYSLKNVKDDLVLKPIR